jgi:hypothetical protein
MEASCQIYATAALLQGKNEDIHCIGGFVSPRAGVDDVEKREMCF